MDHVVITVHGIRTFGHWQQRLTSLIKDVEPGVICQNYSYGYFSVIAFLIPPLRWLVTRRFRKELERVWTLHPEARIDVVAHSFGTHLVGWGLAGIPAHRCPKLDTVILAASVLKQSFPWAEFIQAGQVRRVINECGISDRVLVLNQLVVLFTGLAGRLGFSGMMTDTFLNRYYKGGHSLYFERKHEHADAFMKRHWVPLLLEEGVPERIDQRTTPSVVQGIVVTLLQNAEPIKLCAYLVLLLTPILFFGRIYYELQTTRVRNEMGYASFVESYRFFGKAVLTLHIPYDRMVLRTADVEVLNNAVQFLLTNKYAGEFLIIPHASIEGIDEYNLALGERTSLILREQIVKDGFPVGKVKTVSQSMNAPIVDKYRLVNLLPAGLLREDPNSRVDLVVLGESGESSTSKNTR